MSLFITFEGGEGSGKSTQARLLAEWLSASKRPVVLVREPGSTPLGNELRRIVKGRSMSSTAELLVFAAARAELVDTVIRAHLDIDHVVISDRYSDSTIAYQQYGRGLKPEAVRLAIALAIGGIDKDKPVVPDITFLLDLPPALRGERAGHSQIALTTVPATGRTLANEAETRFERESARFHRRVREGYKALAQSEPERWVVLDATKGIEALQMEIQRRVGPLLPPPAAGAPELLDLTEPEGPPAR